MKSVSNILKLVVPLVLGIMIGAFFLKGGEEADHSEHAHELNADGSWTCSMHPQVRQPEAGACPFCGMDLIPATGEINEDPAVLKMSDAALQLARIETSVVQSKTGRATLTLNGRIKADERRVNMQTTHFGARIEKLYKNYEGEQVKKGDKVASLYSPELLAAQEELLEAKKLEKSNPVLLTAARKKLNYWKLTEEQINQIEASDAPMRNFDLLAGYDGVITHKMASAGDHLHEGGVLFEVTDLSRVWVVFEVYEKDLAKVSVGNAISFTTLTGSETHTATISFIAPEVDPKTRIVEVRADVNNKNGLFKPDMLVQGEVEMSEGSEITVPKSAVLWTGKRSVVYVKIPGEQSFELRQVTLGAGINDQYEIISGLEVGEEVVTHGAFVLDAEAQLRGKISMMNPNTSSGGNAPEQMFMEIELPDYQDFRGQTSTAFQEQITDLSEVYIALKDQMVEGKGVAIRKAGVKVRDALREVGNDLKSDEAKAHWLAMYEPMLKSLQKITQTEDRDFQRMEFINLSKAMINTIQSFGTSLESPLYVQFCPMANNDKGALWISNEEEIINPYFGDQMLHCGNVEEVIEK